MNLLAKTATTVLGLGGASVVGCGAGGVFEFNEQSKPSEAEILWTPLTKDTDFSGTYKTNGSVGKDYGKYLVGVKESNKGGGEASYKKFLEDQQVQNNKRNFSEVFKDKSKVASAYNNSETTAKQQRNNSETTALNRVCESVYKKTQTSDIDFTSTTKTEEKYKLVDDLLRYCSPLRDRPVELEANSSYGDSTIGKDKGVEKKLVKAGENENNGFWEAQQKWFETLGNTSLDQYFGQFFEGNNESKKLKEGQNIRTICDGAYKKPSDTTSASTDNPKVDDVVKYCSFSKLV